MTEMVDLMERATEVARVLGAAHTRTRTSNFAEMVEALMSHLTPGARVVIAAPTLDLANRVFDEAVAFHPSRFAKVFRPNPTQARARTHDGAELLTMSLDRPRRWMGPQFSYAVVVLTPQLADILESLDNLNLALRLGDSPEHIQYVSSRPGPICNKG